MDPGDFMLLLGLAGVLDVGAIIKRQIIQLSELLLHRLKPSKTPQCCRPHINKRPIICLMKKRVRPIFPCQYYFSLSIIIFPCQSFFSLSNAYFSLSKIDRETRTHQKKSST